jgi:hypothetical protein
VDTSQLLSFQEIMSGLVNMEHNMIHETFRDE